ncbi:MAG: succinic semialdehyde dehydrogenase [Aggregatilineales bacterium]
MSIADNPGVGDFEREFIAVTNPLTGKNIGQIAVTTPQEVADAAERARFAQLTWGALTVKERGILISRWRDLLWENQEEGIRLLRAETGKPDGGAFLEFMVVDNQIQYYLHNAAKILQPKTRATVFPMIQYGKVFYKAHGVVGIISPWNYPFLLPFIDMTPALFAGNTILLKPSEVTPFIADFAVKLMYEAGIPRDVVQIVQGDGSTGAALVEEVDYIHFTGSTPVGRKVATRAADRLIPFSLELGGKDPAIVVADADIDLSAAALLRGAFENAGQVCMSVERAYVEAPIYQHMIDRVLHHAKLLTVSAGDGMDVHMGSMTNEREIERTEQHIADAVQKGAKVIHGGNRRPDLGPLFFEPTVLIDVDHSMDIMRDETFGPILPIMKVSNMKEAVRLANDSNYGLAASIFTKNLKRGEALAQQIDTGDVSINRTQFVIGTPAMPSGGQRESGLGRRNGPEGLLKYVSSQSVLVDNGFGQTTDLSLADPTSLKLIHILRTIRKYVPFI